MISGETVLLIIITIINLALWFIFFIRLQRNLSPQKLLSDIKNEVEKLLIEINKTVSEDIRLIEDRARKLKSLVDETDKKMTYFYEQENSRQREQEVLQRLSSKSQRGNPSQTAAKKYQRMARATDSEVDTEGVQLSIDFESYKVDDLQPRREIADRIENLPEITSSSNIDNVQELSVKDKVLQLIKDDFSIDYIAQKVHLTVTEVKMIIDLYIPQ